MSNSQHRQSPRLRASSTRGSNSQTAEPTPRQGQPVPLPQTMTPSAQLAASTPSNIAPRLEPRLRGSFNNNRANVPLYGSLYARDAVFYIKATVTQLKSIVASAPQRLCAQLPTSPTKDMLLETVFAMRTEEAVNSSMNQRTPDQSLQELMNLQPAELKSLATADPSNLAELMSSALQADTQMMPRQVPDSANEMVITVLTWQIEAHKSDRALQDNSPPMPQAADPTTTSRTGPAAPVLEPGPTAQILADPRLSNPAVPGAAPPNQAFPPNALEEILSRLKPNEPPGPMPRGDMDSDEEDWPRASKKHKLQLVPQGFTFGSTSNIDQVLRHYPGKETSSPSLACKELLGPFITVQFIQGGNSVPTFLLDFKHWRKTANGMPSQAEMEAHTLGRIVHLEMLMHESPREALEKRPSLEIAFRRLFALLYVEEATNTGKFKDRTSAWQFVHLLHESIPMGTVMCDHIDDAMKQRISLEKKRLAAIKALEEARAAKPNNTANPRNHGNRGNRRQDRNQSFDRNDRQDQQDRQVRQ